MAVYDRVAPGLDPLHSDQDLKRLRSNIQGDFKKWHLGLQDAWLNLEASDTLSVGSWHIARNYLVLKGAVPPDVEDDSAAGAGHVEAHACRLGGRQQHARLQHTPILSHPCNHPAEACSAVRVRPRQTLTCRGVSSPDQT